MPGAAQHGVFAREDDGGDERLRHSFLRILDSVDGVGDRGEEALGFAAHQRLDQIVAARIAAVGRHAGNPGAADHILDRNALQPNSGCFLQGGVQYALAGAVRGLVDVAARRCAADHLDHLSVDHSASTSGP